MRVFGAYGISPEIHLKMTTNRATVFSATLQYNLEGRALVPVSEDQEQAIDSPRALSNPNKSVVKDEAGQAPEAK